MEAAASLSIPQSELTLGGRLCAAEDTAREALIAPLPQVYYTDHARHLGAARSGIGAVAFAAAWAVGKSLRPEQAVMDALAM